MATSAVSAGTIVVEVLNNRNYVDWSVYLRNYLLAQDLWDAVEATDEPPEDEEKEADDPFKAWRKKNAMALHTIQISCGPEAFALIRDSNSAKFSWDALAANFKTQALLPSDLPVESATSSNNPGYDESVCDFRQYQPFFNAVRSGNWNQAKELLTLHPNAARAKIPYSNKTALYIATELKHEHIVEELVQVMLQEDLEIKSSGWTALAVAADRGNIKIVECMVRKSKKILSIATENSNMTPILLACISEHWDVVRYLYSVSPLEDLMPDKGPYGAGLVCHSIGVKKFGIHIEPTHAMSDIHVSVENEEGNRMDITWSGINRIREMKLIHIQSLEILDRMCEVMTHSDGKEMEDVHEAIFRAVERGIFEFIDRIFQASPNLVWSYNPMRRNAFQFAIECRQEKVYTLIYKLDKRKRSSIANLVDTSKNGMLHVAGMLSPLAKLDTISGAALQMQRELQWFKEVETITFPRSREALNAEFLAPRDVFTKNHKELVKEGERWMKETATSCTVVGALIITIMFASVFTVPGGNNGETGLPIFLSRKLFMVFIVSDAISLFSSTTSVLMFLGILTSRYAEDDFLKSLPTKMIIGLCTLFFSIAAMMVAFSSALFIMIHQQSWIVIPVIFLASVPITLFIWMQFPLLVEMFISTYGSGNIR
ncbi:hypothetical protein ACE6H2_006860 [Prunus campanulata]